MENYIPKIRFKGAYDENGKWVEFTHPWEQRKLGALGTVQTCKRIFKEQTSEQGDIPFFKNGTIGLEPDSYISREVYEEFRRLYPYPEVGDTLISVVGSIGRIAEYTGKVEYFQDSNVVWLKTDGNINKKFLKTSYQVIKWLIEGSTVKHLYNDNILRSEIVMPISQIEQAKIAEFFEAIDNLITLHQRKCGLYQQVKQSMMQKLFSNNADWKKVKFIDLFQEYSELNVNSYNQYTAGKYGLKLISDNKIKYDISKHKYFHPNSLILGIGIEEMGVSKDIFGCVSPIYMVYSINQDIINTEFVNQYLRVELNKYKGTITHRSTRREYEFDNKELHNLKIKIPCLQEQIKIANILSKYDELITTSKNQLDSLQTLKKGLLQQMFC